MAPVIRGNSLYTIVDGPTWTQAEANAVKLGGHLVAINDAEENSFLSKSYSYIATQGSVGWDPNGRYYDSPQGQYYDSIGELWIGLVKNDKGIWEWNNGDTTNYRAPRKIDVALDRGLV